MKKKIHYVKYAFWALPLMGLYSNMVQARDHHPSVNYTFLPLDVFGKGGQRQSDVTVTGQVTGETGEGLPGVTVQLKGTARGTSTGADGSFTIAVPNGNATLVISYIGYVSQEVNINNRSSINISLKPDTKALEEVVVIGYGTVKKSSLTGAVAQIDAKQIEERPIARVDQALAGQVAGVEVRATTGRPGEPLQIRVRGSASVSANNDPLYVLDGVPISDLGSINPGDIASIEILKDAASAAIYGSRGSNGVVLITTKKGAEGKPKIQFNYYYGLQEPERFVDMLSPEEWIDLNYEVKGLNWEAFGRGRGEAFSASDSQADRIAKLNEIYNRTDIQPSDYPNYLHDPRWEYGADSLDFIDWQKEITQLAPMQQYQLSASGGNENVRYLLSGEYLNQDGIVKYTNFERFSFRANLEAKINEYLKVGLNLNPSFSWSEGGATDGRSGIFTAATGFAPVTEKGVGIENGMFPYPTYLWGSSAVSSVAVMRETLNETERMRVLSNIYANITPFEGFNWNVMGAWNFDNRVSKYYLPTRVTPRNNNVTEGSASQANRTNGRTQYYMFQTTLNYNKVFGEHTLDVLAGYSAENNLFDETYQRNSEFPNDQLYTFDNATSRVLNSRNTEGRQTLMSYFTRLQYNYRDKYLLTGSIRRDGYSKFGRNSKWGFFPSFSAGWRLSEEAFMEPLVDVVNNVKLRYSWGVTGNNNLPGNYPAVGVLGISNYSYGGQQIIGYAPSSITNSELGWEQTSASNVGLDLGFFNNRITTSIEYYYKKTKDLLLQVPVAQVTGFRNYWQNIGEVENKGFEVELNTVNLTGAFKWNTSFNIAHNKNKVLKLGSENTPIYTGWDRTVVIKVGEPLISYVLYDAIGVYMTEEELNSSPRMANSKVGDPKYRDVNNDGVIDSQDMTIVGHPNPDFTWGLTNNFNWKNFDLSVLLQGQWGNEIFSLFGRNINRPTTGLANYNALGVFRNRWRSEENPGDGVTPRIDASTAGLYDTRWLYDGMFWKVRNLTLGYNLPKNLIKGVSSARVYFSGENLFMVHHYEGGYSPEAYQSDYYSDWSSYPNARTYTLGVNLTL